MTPETADGAPTWPVPDLPVLVPAWVIERPDSDPARPMFYTTDGTPGPFGWRWTIELAEALRFARRQDAQRIAGASRDQRACGTTGYLHARLVERHFPAAR